MAIKFSFDAFQNCQGFLIFNSHEALHLSLLFMPLHRQGSDKTGQELVCIVKRTTDIKQLLDAHFVYQLLFVDLTVSVTLIALSNLSINLP
jgi:hypothetical protein